MIRVLRIEEVGGRHHPSNFALALNIIHCGIDLYTEQGNEEVKK